MSKGKRFSAFATASVLTLSMAGYFPVAAEPAEPTCTSVTSGVLSVAGEYCLTDNVTGDITLSGNVQATLDLAGFTLNGKLATTGGAELTIADSSEGNGTVTGGTHSNAAQSQGGTMTIAGGTYTKNVSTWGNGHLSISGGKFLASNANVVAQHLATGYSSFSLSDDQIVVEKTLTEDDVTFPEDVEMTVDDTQDFIVVVEPGSEVLHVDYTPVSNDYFEITNGTITAKKVGTSETKVTVSQGNNQIAEKTVKVTINPRLTSVALKDWENTTYDWEWEFVRPTEGPCMGYRTMEAGQTFNLEVETNLGDIEPDEVSIKVYNKSDYDDGALDVASAEGGVLTAENNGWATVEVTATYNGITVVSHGHLRVYGTSHEVVMGDGDTYNGENLTQKINAEDTKLRDVYICPVNAWDELIAKYGDDEREWSDEAWEAWDALWAFCDLPVDPSNYEVTKGSTVVAFLSSFLNTLNPDTYEVWYEYTDGSAYATFVIPERANEVEVITSDVSVADTGLMTAPVNEGVHSTLGATMAAVVAAVVAAFVAIVSRRKA